jgi:hypothetical protein
MGTEERNLPSFVVLAPHLPYAGTQVWSSDFLPVCHQGTRIQPGAEPIRDLRRRSPSEAVQEMELDLLDRFNRRHQQARPSDPLLAGRIRSFETAFGMQREMPEVLDLSGESDATLRLYGLERGSTDGFGWQCLVARRMAERGVRFIQLYHMGWDQHGNLPEQIRSQCRDTDQASAALITDLKQRGLLDDTLVIWGGEFGRTPFREGRTAASEVLGRDHFPDAYSLFLAGGGVKGGISYGQTDELGFGVVENKVHVHDLQATILHLLGFDHTELTFRFQGRDFRLTDVHGHVVNDILT